MGLPRGKRKLELESTPSKSERHRKRKGVSARKSPGRHAVALNDLAWKTVLLPDQLEDAEGFFGLEEVAGVEIAHNSLSGEVEYLLAERPSKKQKKASKQTTVAATVVKPPSVEGDGDGEESEWLGIPDEESEAGNPASPTDAQLENEAVTEPRKNNKKKKTLKQERRRSDGKHHVDRSPIQAGNVFAVLGEEMIDDEVDVSAWDDLQLSDETLLSLAKLGFNKPTPIQSAAIPEICAGRDVIGKAPTGSGKTLAFGIPILEHYLRLERASKQNSKPMSGLERPDPCALILSPTRELAHQLSSHLGALFSNVPSGGPSIVTLTGGLSLQKQRRLLLKADIVIGTPGRLWEVISEGRGVIRWLKWTRFVVIDEADRLLSDGHYKEFEEIVNCLDREDDVDDGDQDGQEEEKQGKQQRQTLVFSATLHRELQQKLSGKAKATAHKTSNGSSLQYLVEKLKFREEKPKFIDVNRLSHMAERIKEGLVECAAMEKDLYLYAVLVYHLGQRSLIFSNSISAVRRLTHLLQELGLEAQALHSQMTQKARLRAVERFSSANGKYNLLVATDVAARGLDIPHVQVVVHYHLPRTADMYVHRSGRTARRDESGSSVLLCAPDEVVGMRRLVAKVHASSEHESRKAQRHIRPLNLDRQIVARLKPRVTLAKQITDSMLAKEKKGSEDGWLQAAAAELGVDYDSEEFEAAKGTRKGRGTGRLKAAREARSLTKADIGALRATLKRMLQDRINLGVSERYLTAGQVNIDELLEKGTAQHFLGTPTNLGLGVG